MASPPCRALISAMRVAIRSSASSQSTRVNVPWPLAPLRTAGYNTRSSPYTRSPNRRTFAQMKLRVTGLSSPPSIFLMRPCSTVTSSVQESGQSSGQAVRTVELPQVSGGAVRAIPALSPRTPRSSESNRGVEPERRDGVYGGEKKGGGHGAERAAQSLDRDGSYLDRHPRGGAA